MEKRTKHQEKIIRNYYDNREAIAMQRLQELVTDLYLSEGKKRQQHYKRLATHLAKLGVPQAHIDHLIEQDDPEAIANYIKKLDAKSA